MRSFVFVLALAATCYQATNANAAVLISNGSFEVGTFAGVTPDGPGAIQLQPSALNITGWAVTGNEIAWIEEPKYGISTPTGTRFLDLTGYNDLPGGVAQTVSGLTSGQQYRLTFDVGSRNFQTAGVTAYVGGTPLGQFFSSSANSVVWAPATVTFTAASSSASIRLAGTSLTAFGDFIGLDNVALAEVAPTAVTPEPASLALWGLGSLGCMVLGYRKRKLAAA